METMKLIEYRMRINRMSNWELISTYKSVVEALDVMKETKITLNVERWKVEKVELEREIADRINALTNTLKP